MDTYNFITAEININKDDTSKDIRIINSFEETKRVEEWGDKVNCAKMICDDTDIEKQGIYIFNSLLV